MLSFNEYIKVFENFDSEYYDSLLDRYNEFGESDFSEEELEYLKTGGRSKKPHMLTGVIRGLEENLLNRRLDGISVIITGMSGDVDVEDTTCYSGSCSRSTKSSGEIELTLKGVAKKLIIHFSKDGIRYVKLPNGNILSADELFQNENDEGVLGVYDLNVSDQTILNLELKILSVLRILYPSK